MLFVQLLLQQLPFPLQAAPVTSPQLPTFAVPAAQQTCEPEQVVHVLPVFPQAAVVVPGWQTPFWQQPVGQLVESQTHDLLTHRVPPGQETQIPPPVPHAVFVVPV